MSLLNKMHSLHSSAAFSTCTLWDRWLPHATLWTSELSASRYRGALLGKRIDSQGYVSMQQHRGMAHSEGWPFPAWQQTDGRGFHFSVEHEAWAIHNFDLKPLQDTEGWDFYGVDVLGIDPRLGLQLKSTESTVHITTPEFHCDAIVAPFLRLEWAINNNIENTKLTIQWLNRGAPEWTEGYESRTESEPKASSMHYLNIPLYKAPNYEGTIARYRIIMNVTPESRIDIKSLITAIDTRHPITNSNYLKACTEYFCWTGDLPFLEQNIERMRAALRFAIEEFGLREGRHVQVSWVGHDGRSGLELVEDPLKHRRHETRMRPGWGVGNNYWDLLPFGGQDALATIYLYDAMVRMAKLEAAISLNPHWKIKPVDDKNTAEELQLLANGIKTDFQQRFWNQQSGRFVGWIDIDGKAYDYGFTFVNLEAIYYELASAQQVKSIFDWIDGHRIIEADTSSGSDIYHWRFAPRATTRRNIETYVWAWNSPHSIDWGGQVQDGGAVLGFSYHDLMARLKNNGPDDAWHRLKQILRWFDDICMAGGYRSYYETPDRGTLQGGGTAGGLGLDHEFLESVLVPQVMLYGFLGFEPTANGFGLNPRLPSDWPSLTITNINYRERLLDITAHCDGKIEVFEHPKGP